MKNSNLISTVIYAQVLLIFISFKIPDGFHKKEVKSSTSVKEAYKNTASIVSEKRVTGEANGVNYNFNYPSIFSVDNKNYSLFNNEVTNKIKEGKFKIGFGHSTPSMCNQPIVNDLITNQYTDFKLYNENKTYLSLLLLKADYLNNYTYPQYSFHTINYNLKSQTLIEFDDLFTESTKGLFVKLLNSSYNKLGNCETISADVFDTYRNNFVISSSAIKFYFDECLMCSDHHREYAVEIPLKEIDKSMILLDIMK